MKRVLDGGGSAVACLDGAGAGTYVHTGGSWVYGDTNGVQNETAPWHPPGAVAWRKAVEDAVLARAEEGGRPVIVQPGLIYGGRHGLIDDFYVKPGKRTGATDPGVRGSRARVAARLMFLQLGQRHG